MDLRQRAQNMIDEFSRIPDWEERYKLVIQKGKALQDLDESLMTEKYKVKGCQSQVWLVPELSQGKVHFQAGSDAMIVKGIISLLVEIYSDATPDDILGYDPEFLKEIGITEHLSMNRTNGLASMVKQIKMYAIAYQSLVSKGIKDANNL
jgi:cysteine desulfuration protein SufE